MMQQHSYSRGVPGQLQRIYPAGRACTCSMSHTGVRICVFMRARTQASGGAAASGPSAAQLKAAADAAVAEVKTLKRKLEEMTVRATVSVTHTHTHTHTCPGALERTYRLPSGLDEDSLSSGCVCELTCVCVCVCVCVCACVSQEAEDHLSTARQDLASFVDVSKASALAHEEQLGDLQRQLAAVEGQRDAAERDLQVCTRVCVFL